MIGGWTGSIISSEDTMGWRGFRTTAAVIAALVAVGWAHVGQAQTESRFGSRSPRTCRNVTTSPNAQQAAALIQCGYERTSHDFISLVEQVRVELGGARPFNSFADGYATDIDASAKVLPIRGSSITYMCGAISDMAPSNRGKNCVTERNPEAKGICWRTTFKDWRCSMMQVIGSQKAFDQAPPR
jgi:hypothetical protein